MSVLAHALALNARQGPPTNPLRKVCMRPLRSRPPLTEWRTSSFCQTGECAEVAWDNARDVVLRNSRMPRVVVRFTSEEWDALVRGIQAGEFSTSHDSR